MAFFGGLALGFDLCETTPRRRVSSPPFRRHPRPDQPAGPWGGALPLWPSDGHCRRVEGYGAYRFRCPISHLIES